MKSVPYRLPCDCSAQYGIHWNNQSCDSTNVPRWTQAYNNAINLEMKSQSIKRIKSLCPHVNEDEIIKLTWSILPKSPKICQRKITFGETRVHALENPSQIKETRAISYETKSEITSGKLLEKYLLPLLMSNKHGWETNCDNRANLNVQLSTFSLTLEQLVRDLKYIMSKFRQGRIAILDYKSSWKLPPFYFKQEFSPSLNRLFKTNEKIYILPKLRFYLIKVIKDQDTAAFIIQAAWREWKIYMNKKDASGESMS